MALSFERDDALSGTESHLPTVRSFRGHPSALHQIRTFIRERASDRGLSESETTDLLIAVSEASSNALLHSESPTISITWRGDRDGVEVTIRDDGVFRRWVRVPELDGPGGRGIPLMMALMDEVDIREGSARRPGTVVRLVKRTLH